MDERSSSAVVITRKRGHQHHPRQSGTRRSNVPALEVIAALRGETLPYHHPLIDDQSLDVDNNNVVITTQTDRSEMEPASTPVLSTIDINSRRDLHEIIGGSAISNASPSPPPHNDNNNCDTYVQKQQQQQLDNAISCDVDGLSNVIIAADIDGNSLPVDVPVKKIRKSKPKPSQDPLNPTAGSRTKSTELKRRKKQLNTPREERPPLEGAAATDEPDIENDPEAAEWLKLRCTSERTEVVAEREYRRQNRRCADYPGLAFGRSIFSSDTMMKFNIIRNELHNIMNTQLKRVRYVDGETTKQQYHHGNVKRPYDFSHYQQLYCPFNSHVMI